MRHWSHILWHIWFRVVIYKTETTNKIPGEGVGSYLSNPFLTGKIPSPGAGGPQLTPTSKPIGYGNPFLQGTAGAVAGAGAWSHAGPGVAASPGNDGKNVVSIGGQAPKPIGKDNPFLSGLGHGRGDIGIDATPNSIPGGSFAPGSNTGNSGLSQTK